MRSLPIAHATQLSREQILGLKPVKIDRNRYNVETRTYNRCDVAALQVRIDDTLAATAVPAQATGELITRTDAKTRYQLADAQLDRLTPAVTKANPHRASTVSLT